MSSNKVPDKRANLIGEIKAITEGLKTISTAVVDCTRISEENRTRRAEIQRDRDIAVEDIQARRAILEKVIEETFSERRDAVNKLFQGLDEGIRTGNLDLVELMAANITDVVKTSPLTTIAETRTRLIEGEHVFRIGKQK